jgi:hypothetical protein
MQKLLVLGTAIGSENQWHAQGLAQNRHELQVMQYLKAPGQLDLDGR